MSATGRPERELLPPGGTARSAKGAPSDAAGSFCFHCGEQADPSRWRASIAGHDRAFCCAGCEAVARTIDAAGLGDYYTLRTGPSPRAQPPALPASLFDRAQCRAALTTDGKGFSHARLALDGVRCPACLWLIGEQLRRTPGVVAAEVDYALQVARVGWVRGSEQLGAAIAAIEALGYGARPIVGAQRPAAGEKVTGDAAAKLVFALVAGMAVMNGALALYLAGTTASPLPLWEVVVRWTSAVLCLPILAWSGADFFTGAVRDLRNRRPGMDVPIALGLAAAFAASVAGLATDGPVYFDSIAMLVAAVLGARALESQARRRAAAILDRLSILEPLVAHRLAADGSTDEVAALDLSPGDRVRVLPGETVPTDGELDERDARVDESHLTGEPLAQHRGRSETVVAGSVNAGDAFTLRVTRAGDASTLGELRALLERGLASRPLVGDLADRLAPALVTGVVATAGATLAGWLAVDPARAWPAAIAVLIVTCPCALALATPLTLALAAARFARAGIAPLRMAALEALATAGTVVLDKTGTLTQGRLVLVGTTTFGIERDRAIALAAALEATSSHPVAIALRTSADQPVPMAVVDADAEAGGVTACVDGRRWWIGAPEFAADDRAPVAMAVRKARDDGALVAVLTDRRDRAAVFAFDDPARDGLSGLGTALRRLGIARAVCLSGDRGAAVARHATVAGIDDAVAGCSAGDKLDWVRRAQERGARVVMIGDGLNDAATLAAADASISFASAPARVQSTADFLVLGASLEAVVLARAIARQSRSILRQNLAWALGYNVVAIPLAAAGLVSPWLAALGMAASSTLVVANALRLSTGVGPAAAAPPRPGLPSSIGAQTC